MNKYKLSILSLLASLVFVTKSCAIDTLNLETYLETVIEYHPLILKANINRDIAEFNVLKGKGALDPKIYSDFDQKQFDDIDYFTVWQTEVKIPTILPIDFSVGYERNEGVFLNQENSVPRNGLVYGTINLSLLRGLLFDEQRHNIQSAEVKGLKSLIEQEIVTREILFQAINTYLNWASKNNTVDINQSYLQLVNDRHQNVIQLFENGDSPAIDTLESRLNINSAEKLLLDSQNKLLKAKQKLSLFIWNANGQPLQINNRIQPMAIERLIIYLDKLSNINNPNFGNDPLIAKIDNEILFISLDNRLEKENLKPQLDLKYNTILNVGKDDFDPTFTFNDYKYGVTFQYPILNRKTKGQIKLNEAITRQNELDKVEYLGQLNNKFVGLVSQESIQDNLLEVSVEKLTNSQLLYEAEVLKFNLGESSIFLLNSRERKLLEAQIDLVKSYHSLGMVLSELYYLKLGQG